MRNGWQHKRSFVIKFSLDADPEEGRFIGRVEHVASGQTTHFESSDALASFLNDVLKKVRHEFQEAERQRREI
jgi:small ligand-binding sensory domain FIST